VRILYVEDNDDNIYMLRNRLMRAGFNVIIATDGAQGITMAASEQPDLILMDITLPDISGEEATRRLKADRATKHIPVIALTANAILAIGKRHSLRVATTSIPNQWRCRALSKRSTHLNLDRLAMLASPVRN
jgi:CheY-like chemotaxis protein